MIKPYDHGKKAGNQGDICKHVALVAALDESIARADRHPFRFADLYAGYAKNPILEGQDWSNGIGKIAGEQPLEGNRHVKLWATLSGLNQKPLVGGFYPGSAWFAMGVSERWNTACELSLWDTGAGPFRDLTTTFPNGHHVFNRAAAPNEPAVKSADLIFIDPPDKDKCTWAIIREHVRNLGPKQRMLIWLPIAANTHHKPPAQDRMSSQCRAEFFEAGTNIGDGLHRGLGATTIRWAEGGRTIGCQLLYCVDAGTQQALRAAVDEVVRVAGWPAPRHYP